ncbi:MAG: hypothetical protein FWD58_01150 [Firmicutes bacterium]|nr:hypothetical protein [Bacillota bacterium]
MIKKIIFVGALLVVAMGLFASCGNGDDWTRLKSEECCGPTETTDAYWDNIGKSSAELEGVLKYFTVSGEKRTDDFGGVYIDDNGILNVCVVGNRTPVKSDYIIYKRVKNSYNFLYGVYEGASDIITEYSVWSVAICEKCNRVAICLEKESEIQPLVDALKAKGLHKKGSISIFVGENNIVLI